MPVRFSPIECSTKVRWSTRISFVYWSVYHTLAQTWVPPCVCVCVCVCVFMNMHIQHCTGPFVSASRPGATKS